MKIKFHLIIQSYNSMPLLVQTLWSNHWYVVTEHYLIQFLKVHFITEIQYAFYIIYTLRIIYMLICTKIHLLENINIYITKFVKNKKILSTFHVLYFKNIYVHFYFKNLDILLACFLCSTCVHGIRKWRLIHWDSRKWWFWVTIWVLGMNLTWVVWKSIWCS